MPLDCHLLLAQIVAKTSWLPHPDIVSQFSSALFPTIRRDNDAQIRRRERVMSGESAIGMFDNNRTPKLALAWTHGIEGATTGWTIAHVWPSSKQISAYTHLANLALIPEALSTTTDKNGPLTNYLRWHSWEKYRWRPSNEPEPTEPPGYKEISWRYLQPTFAVENCKKRSSSQS